MPIESIVIAEKPSQARDIIDAVGSGYGPVLAAQGHLLTLMDPHEVNPDWKSWSYELLQPETGFYPLKKDTGGGKAEKLKAILAALKTAKRVIIATDKDREGQAIAQNILEFAKFKGEVLRADFVAQDKTSLKEAFSNLKPNSEYEAFYQAAIARAQLDQIANFSATRAVSNSLKPAGQKTALGIGRVKTPTMAIVCRRELAITHFSPTTFYIPKILVEREDCKVWLKSEPKSDEERILKLETANEQLSRVLNSEQNLCVVRKTKHQAPPRFMDMPTLQGKAAKWGWSAAKTLKTTQALYETHKITTYPRTESRYLPEIEAKNVSDVLSGLTGLGFETLNQSAPVIRVGKKGHFSDKALEGHSHHAVIPNIKTASEWVICFGKLSDDERKLFNLIAKTYITAVSPDYIYDSTKIQIDIKTEDDGTSYSAIGNVEVSAGWKALVPTKKKEADVDLPNWRDGDVILVSDTGTDTSTTKIPQRYDEGSLIGAMKAVWKQTDDPQLAERLKDSNGIGTGATRDTIIEGLKNQGFFEIVKGKVHATELAMSLYHILDAEVPEVLSAVTTAEMELVLLSVAKGEMTALDAVNELLIGTKKLLHKMKCLGKAKNPMAGLSKPTPKMISFAKKLAKKLAKTPGNTPLTNEILNSSALCRAYISDNTGSSSAQPKPPTSKQISFAKKLAKGSEIPPNAMASSKSLSKWISANK